MPAISRLTSGLAVLAIFYTSCTSYTGKSFIPHISGYNDDKHEVFVLNKELLEVSGIVNLGDLRFASINDEDGELFFVNLKSDSIVKYRFKGKGDYEDLAKADSTYFILESSGDLIELDSSFTSKKTYKFRKKNIEFESLVYYPHERKLVMITKEQRKQTRGISAYSFDLDKREFDPKIYFNISFKEVFTILTNYNVECKPSSAAINPLNNKLYVIASVGKVLLECQTNGKLERIYKLNPTHFPQPEGITFATNGDMYISNEGADGKATILKFPYGGLK